MIYKIYKKKDFGKIWMFLNNNFNNDGVIFKKNVLPRILLHINNIRHFLWKWLTSLIIILFALLENSKKILNRSSW